MIVLQVLPALNSGGVERGALEIAQAVAASGGTALVASSGGRLAAAVQQAGGTCIDVPLDAKSPAAILRNAARLASLIRAAKPDIVHARSRAPAWSAWLACRATKTPFVTTYHGAYAENAPLKRRYNAVMAKGDRVIAISNFIADLIVQRHGVGQDRLRIIPRGVDPAIFSPQSVTAERQARLAAAWRIGSAAPIVLLPGRLSHWKGQDVLIEALAQLPCPAVAVLAGAGKPALAAALGDKAARLGVLDRVRLVGDCDDMAAALSLAHVVTAPSTEPEAFGRTVIEAQAMQRPIIASDHGGAVETIEHGRTGWRVKPGDAEALAATLAQTLALSDEARRQVGEQARAAVLARYTTAAMQQATLAVYRELLG